MIVEHERRALCEVELVGQREGEEIGRDGRLRQASERTERRHPVAGLDGGVLGRAAHHTTHLAARNERQRGFHLVHPAGLQQLWEGDPGDVDVDQDSGARRQHVRGLGLWQLDQRQRAVGP